MNGLRFTYHGEEEVVQGDANTEGAHPLTSISPERWVRRDGLIYYLSFKLVILGF